MKAILLGLGLSLGAALAQGVTPMSSIPVTPLTIPALPPSATPAASVTLRFNPQPGTSVSYTLGTRSRFKIQSVQLRALPGKTLSPEQEQERQQIEASLKRVFDRGSPDAMGTSGSLHIQVLPLLADGSRVLDITEDILMKGSGSTAPKSLSITLRQTLYPDGHVGSVLQDASDPLMKQLGAGLNSLMGQAGSNFAGTDSSLFGRPLRAGESFGRSDTVDFARYLGSIFNSVAAGSQVSGSLTAQTITTYHGMDAGGRVRISTIVQIAPASFTIKFGAKDSLSIRLLNLQGSGQSLLRPDGLLASNEVNTSGDLQLTMSNANQPYQTVVTMHLDQTVTTQEQ